MRLLDLFCGAGGAAMGYYRAGFTEILGVDIMPQKNYPFAFSQGDALEFLATVRPGEYDLIHASPPCQRYSVANNIHGRKDHPDLLERTRWGLELSGVPWVIENVPGAPMRDYVVICGRALGLGVKRHRWFESSERLRGTICPHAHPGDWVSVYGHTVLERGHQVGIAKGGGPVIRRRHLGTQRGREAMGIPWMTRCELSEAVPPAYTELVGGQIATREPCCLQGVLAL